jgi:hypothetical protein
MGQAINYIEQIRKEYRKAARQASGHAKAGPPKRLAENGRVRQSRSPATDFDAAIAWIRNRSWIVGRTKRQVAQRVSDFLRILDEHDSGWKDHESQLGVPMRDRRTIMADPEAEAIPHEKTELDIILESIDDEQFALAEPNSVEAVLLGLVLLDTPRKKVWLQFLEYAKRKSKVPKRQKSQQ